MNSQLRFQDEDHSYWIGKKEYPSVTKILQALGLTPDYSTISSVYADRGKAVHKALEYVDKGTLDQETLDPRLLPYVSAYRRFVLESGYRSLYWELPMYHENLGFAGTPDKIGYLNGRVGILDIKTSRTVDHSADLQLCGYSVLYNASYPQSPSTFKYVLQLTEDWKWNLITKYSDTLDAMWMSALDLYKWKVKYKKI